MEKTNIAHKQTLHEDRSSLKLVNSINTIGIQ